AGIALLRPARLCFPVAVLVLADGELVAPQREVDLEHCLERPPMALALHERRRQRVLERLASLERDVSDGLHGVEVLRQRDRQAGGTQLLDEAGEKVEHGRPAPRTSARG